MLPAVWPLAPTALCVQGFHQKSRLRGAAQASNEQNHAGKESQSAR